MTNPDQTVGTNAGYDGRTTPNAMNDILGAFSRGRISGWACSPKSGMTVQLGGDGTTRDVAIAEDNAGNRLTINNRTATPVEITIAGAPATGNRIDSIVAYIANPPTGAGATSVDFPDAVGIIAVSGTAAGTPSAPNEATIRDAITADGASGASAYYVVLANITVGQGVTTIGSGVISAGAFAQISTDIVDPTPADGSITTNKLANLAVTTGKIANRGVTGAKIDFSTVTSAMLEDIPIGTATATDYIKFTVGTVNTLNAFRFGNIVMINWDISHVGAVNGQKVVGTATNKIANTAYGAGRVSGGSATIPATLVAIPGGDLRLHTTGSGTGTAGTIWLFVND